MIEGAIIALISVCVGWMLGRWRRPQRTPKTPKPFCGCGHHLSFHSKQGCAETVRVVTRYSLSGNPTAYSSRPCNCRRYVLKDDAAAATLGLDTI